jgi:hypothetical protein
MYVSLLSGALDLWDTDLDNEALLDHVRECRAALPAQDLGAGVMSETVLVTEITYDRALVCLAAERGIDVTPKNFVHPKIERERLEVELVRRGVDLEVQARRPSSEAPDPAAGGPRTLNRSDLPS